jgi:hypothetical protein
MASWCHRQAEEARRFERGEENRRLRLLTLRYLSQAEELERKSKAGLTREG